MTSLLNNLCAKQNFCRKRLIWPLNRRFTRLRPGAPANFRVRCAKTRALIFKNQASKLKPAAAARTEDGRKTPAANGRCAHGRTFKTARGAASNIRTLKNTFPARSRQLSETGGARKTNGGNDGRSTMADCHFPRFEGFSRHNLSDLFRRERRDRLQMRFGNR